MATAPTNNPGSYASASLYVGDLANEVTEALLFEIFNAVGPVASVRVCRDAATRRSLGYAYVNFHRVEDAERALDTMNFKNIRNKACRIMWSHRDPSLRRSGLGNIFVKNLAKSIDNKRLYDTFSMFGNILSCKVSVGRNGESLGYGFVHYESDEAAQTAITRVDGKVICMEKVSVSAFKSRKERGGNKFRFTNVYVKNLPAIEKAELDDIFSKYGTVTSSMISNGPPGSDKVFAFVNYATPEMAAAAVEATNGMKVKDKELYVVRAQKKEEREKELRERFEMLRVERQRKNAGTNLYVKNLSDDMTDDKLREEFVKFGDITSARIMADGVGKSKGFGFVCFSSPEEATKAVTEMNGRMVDNKPLYVALAQRKDQRRVQLEAQHAQRAKMGAPVPQPQMFPQQMMAGGPPSGPIFYQGVPQRGNFVYPQQMMQARQWNPNHQQQQQQVGMMGGRPHPGQQQQFQLMQLNQRGQQQGQQQPQQGQQQQQQQPQQQRGQRGPQRGGQPNRGMPQQKEAVVQAQGQGRAEPLTIKALAAAPEEQKKQMIGERLFPLIKAVQPTLAGKITGMLLEMDNGELLHLLESGEALNEKVGEALAVLNSVEAGKE